jgi:hypothetical protein
MLAPTFLDMPSICVCSHCTYSPPAPSWASGTQFCPAHRGERVLDLNLEDLGFQINRHVLHFITIAIIYQPLLEALFEVVCKDIEINPEQG